MDVRSTGNTTQLRCQTACLHRYTAGVLQAHAQRGVCTCVALSNIGLLSASSTAVVMLVLLVVPSRAASGDASHCPFELTYCEPGVLLVNMLVITTPGVAPA